MQTLIAFSVYIIVAAIITIFGAVVWDEGRMTGSENRVIRYSFYAVITGIHMFALCIFAATARYINS